MQPITVTVGPLAAASANGVAAVQTPTAGTIALTGTPTSGTNTKASQVTASIAGNVMTVTATASGGMTPGQLLSGASGVQANTKVVAYGITAGTYIVTPAQTVSSSTIYGNQVVTLDVARQILITTTADESAKTVVITGTDWAGTPITESFLAPNNSTRATTQSFKTVTQATISATAAAGLTLGTNGVGASPWVRMDGFASPQITVQAVASGTVNYTIQQTMDDPNGIVNAVSPGNVTWNSSGDSAAVGATGTVMSNFAYAPTFARVLMNSGNGTVTTTFTQAGVAPY